MFDPRWRVLIARGRRHQGLCSRTITNVMEEPMVNRRGDVSRTQWAKKSLKHPLYKIRLVIDLLITCNTIFDIQYLYIYIRHSHDSFERVVGSIDNRPFTALGTTHSPSRCVSRVKETDVQKTQH